MNRARVGLVCALLATLAIWGCAQGPGDAAAVTKLENDVRSLTNLREQLKKDLETAKNDINQIQADLQQLRDTLAQRTTERDAGIAQLDQLKKGLKTLVDQAEAAAPIIKPPVTTAAK